ncbi:thioesterase family protein [Fodinicola feengrottensis]|uniref:acyl-CoA thioesterase domain-containing protein n=1 Tax=Fodinicola feengrottensis TaxID=435914 RepID=UPI0024430571|nr:acyl-CoA thioesterase domain-containing protein [Fodinicola feengrottensis]
MPPALFAVWTEASPVPSAELTVHFGSALDAGPADGWALVRIETRDAGDGWAIDDSTVWSADGTVLALARDKAGSLSPARTGTSSASLLNLAIFAGGNLLKFHSSQSQEQPRRHPNTLARKDLNARALCFVGVIVKVSIS